MSLAASWNARGSAAEVMVPKVPLEFLPSLPGTNVMLGRPKMGWLKALKASTRNSLRRCSVMGVVLMSEMSESKAEGPRTLGSVRGTLPKRYSCGLTKASLLNHCLMVGLDSFALTPGTKSGRVAAKLLAPLMVRGVPVFHCVMVFNCQP